MRLDRLVLVVVLTFFAVAAPNEIGAAKNPSKDDLHRDEQQKKLTKTLQAESLGVTTNRAEQLKALIDSGTDLDQAYWQAGYVKYYDKWIPLDEALFSTAEKEQREQYVNYRKQFWGNDEEHLQIARWCAEHSLADQARAHLMAILLNHPDQPELRTVLGYQFIDGRWMNESEYKTQVQATQRYVENLKKWIPVAESLRTGLTAGSKSTRADTLNRLTEIDTIDAWPALELRLMPVSPRLQEDCIDWLLANDHRESSLALCRIAMSSQSDPIRSRIITELRTRPFDDYFPPLIRELKTPVDIKISPPEFRKTIGHTISIYTEYISELTQPIKLTHETWDAEQTVIVNLIIESYHLHSNPIVVLRRDPWLTNEQRAYLEQVTRAPLHFELPHLRSRTSALNGFLQKEEYQRHKLNQYDQVNEALNTIEAANDATEARNQQISRFLSQLLDKTDLVKPQDWWNWWLTQLDMDSQKANSVTEVVEDWGNNFQKRSGSCFIKGTPVYSEIGPVPIEILRVGDRVLAQNVDTGELTYKPVIRTTVRRPRPLVVISLGNETITATRGHPFWVAGTGWVKSRDLKPGHMLHTATGAVKVDSVVSAPEQETYNLIVDGFHTYFVGNERALVHDVSLTTPTDAVVPGLIER